jgi:hypothetical protein
VGNVYPAKIKRLFRQIKNVFIEHYQRLESDQQPEMRNELYISYPFGIII